MQQRWRSLLSQIIEDPREKQRIARELRINPVTLTRWATTDDKPRLYLLEPLVEAVSSQYRDKLLTLIKEAFPGFGENLAKEAVSNFPAASEEVSSVVASLKILETVLPRLAEAASTGREALFEEIPSKTLYAQVLSTYASIRPDERFWHICKLILPECLRQLDPDRLGMELLVAQCLPPLSKGTKVHSLRERVGVGTPPWKADLEEKQFFLGAETLAGYAVSRGHFAVVHNENSSFLPVCWGEHEKSSGAFPIMQAGCIAGALICSSTQVDYFTGERLALLQHSTNLIALAFQTEEFYPSQEIALRIMPPYDVQQKHFLQFRKRIQEEMMQAPMMTLSQAEQSVRQLLEKELFLLLNKENSTAK